MHDSMLRSRHTCILSPHTIQYTLVYATYIELPNTIYLLLFDGEAFHIYFKNSHHKAFIQQILCDGYTKY